VAQLSLRLPAEGNPSLALSGAQDADTGHDGLPALLFHAADGHRLYGHAPPIWLARDDKATSEPTASGPVAALFRPICSKGGSEGDSNRPRIREGNDTLWRGQRRIRRTRP
jgi:hypothetical protein